MSLKSFAASKPGSDFIRPSMPEPGLVWRGKLREAHLALPRTQADTS